MQTEHSKMVIDKLEGIFNRQYLSRAEMTDLLVELDVNTAIRAVDHIRLNGIFENGNKLTFLPNVVQFYDVYRMVVEKVEKKNNRRCLMCNDKGYMLHTSVVGGHPYEHVLYCPSCQEGEKCAYDGRKSSKGNEKSEYYVEPITKYYSTEELKKNNNQRSVSKPVPMPYYVKEVCKKYGISVKALNSMMDTKGACPW